MNPCVHRALRRRGRSVGALARLGAGVVLACAAGTASATWSIVIIDVRTGEVALGSATCLTNFDLQANTPVLIVGVGGATAQSSVDQDATNRTLIRDQLYLGTAPAQILNLLAAKEGSAHQSRQYGIADTRGRAVTFSGANAAAWAGGTVGQIDNLVYAVQGNILVGPDVVAKAVEEIRKPGGDVPDKLMRAMEKAMQFGGDGRCTQYGKSAHIAYMLIGRAGDRDASNGNYRVSNTGQTVAIGDLNNDGMPEIITESTTGVSVLKNITLPGKAPMFAPFVNTPAGNISFREMLAVDLDGDGNIDIVGTDNANDRVRVLKGNGTLTPTAPVDFAAGDGPAGLVVARLNGDALPDIATANITGDSVSVLLNNGAGGFNAPVNYPAGDGATLVQAGDLDGDGDIDLASTSNNVRALVTLLNDGNGVFTPEPGISFSTTPLGLAVADLDGDGKAEIIVGLNTETNIRVLKRTGSGYSETLYPAGAAVSQLFVVDMDGDGLLDIVTRATNVQRMVVLKGLPGGTFGPATSYPSGFAVSKFAMADMTNDGLPDAACTINVSAVGMAMYNSKGAFGGESGLAGGDYFLSLNVPNRQTTDEDPVITLRTMFNAWRAGLVGMTDAVQSSAVFDDSHINPDGSAVATLTITLRDYSGQAVTVPLADVSVTHSGGALSTPGTLTANLDGTFSLPVTAGTVCGVDRYRVTVAASPRPIILMPEAALAISPAGDFNLDGVVNEDDRTQFTGLFLVGDPGADFNGDGYVDGIDSDLFMNAFEQGGC